MQHFHFLILKIEVCFSLYFRRITPWVGKIYPQLKTPARDNKYISLRTVDKLALLLMGIQLSFVLHGTYVRRYCDCPDRNFFNNENTVFNIFRILHSNTSFFVCDAPRPLSRICPACIFSNSCIPASLARHTRWILHPPILPEQLTTRDADPLTYTEPSLPTRLG